MKQRVIGRVKLDDNREVRITRISTGAGTVIRVGTHLLPSGEPMSGAVFPASEFAAVAEAIKVASVA
jgi:hypothetical protein